MKDAMTEELKLIEAQIKDQEGILKTLKDRQDSLLASDRERRLEPYRALAALSHDIFCEQNHTDYCSWHYENDNWEACTHRRWLEATEKACKDYKTEPRNVIKALEFYHQFKQKNGKEWVTMQAIKRFS